MIHRTALFAGSLVAALTLAVGLVAAGFAPHADPVGGVPAQPAAATAEVPAAPTIQVDTIYVAAPVKPQEITVTTAVTAPAHHGDDGAEGDND